MLALRVVDGPIPITYNIAKSINGISTVSSVDTAAVLEAFLTVVPEKLAEGNIVEWGDFGSFRRGFGIF